MSGRERRVAILPETVQNKIAAGEVIERPASVVKELVENAMDAGAAMVSVELEEGGHRLIRVSDDGAGMTEDDLVASLQRHATSKIREVEDIFRITSFGFRGEALPSIGSVSRMTIATATAGAAEGRELSVEGGRVSRLSPAPPRKGTRVEVRDIFFNTPARRKFLRQPASEGTRTGEILTRLALGNPAIGFRLQTGGRITLSVTPAATQLERMADLFGRELADKMVPFRLAVAEGLSVSGYFAKPPKSCRNTSDIYIMVNRRWIRYYALARAVGDAFQGILPPREYPFAVVNLDVDPERVDVNVHPAKEEVRFEQEKLLISGVRQAIRDALSGIASLPALVNLPSPGISAAARPPAARSFSARRAGTERAERRLPLQSALPGTTGGGMARLDLPSVRERLRGPDAAPPADAADAAPPPRPADPSPSRAVTVGPAGQHRILGQAGGKYIVVDGPDGILLVDPHALHERWNFDRLVEERRRGAAAKTLLLPLEMRLSPAEASAAAEAVPSLAEYGFEFEMPEPNRMRVTASPSFIPPARLEDLIRQVLADAGEADATMEAARERLLASLACRSSVLLGKNLPEEEIRALLDRFFNDGQMPTCPHGRPTAIKIGWNELAGRFGR